MGVLHDPHGGSPVHPTVVRRWHQIDPCCLARAVPGQWFDSASKWVGYAHGFGDARYGTSHRLAGLGRCSFRRLMGTEVQTATDMVSTCVGPYWPLVSNLPSIWAARLTSFADCVRSSLRSVAWTVFSCWSTRSVGRDRLRELVEIKVAALLELSGRMSDEYNLAGFKVQPFLLGDE